MNEAHKAGVPVHCHAYGGPGVALAVENDVDLIHSRPTHRLGVQPNLAYGNWQTHRKIDGGRRANGDYMGTYAKMAEKGIFWAPTLSYYYKFATSIGKSSSPRSIPSSWGAPNSWPRASKRISGSHTKRACQSYWAAIRECPSPIHGDSAWELTLFVKFGCRPGQGIEAATLQAAKSLWIDDRTGSLEVGKRADLLVLKADPLKDIAVLTVDANIEQVYLEGELRAESGGALPVDRATMLRQLEKLETLDEYVTTSPYHTGALGKRVVDTLMDAAYAQLVGARTFEPGGAANSSSRLDHDG